MSQPHFLLDILGSRRHQDLISWTFTDGFSFQIEKVKEMAALWSDQRARTPNPKKKIKTKTKTLFTRRDSHISHLSFLFQIL